MIAALLKIFLFQAALFAVIAVVLKNILERQLIESAIQKLETLDPRNIDSASETVVVSYRALKHADASRIQHALFQKTNRVPLLKIEQDKSLKGGIIIKGKAMTIDHSLKNRLEESGLRRSVKS